jgi:hypothetical protein
MKKLFYSKSYLLKFSIVLLLLFASGVVFSQTAPVVTPKGGFKIDGQLRANTPEASRAGDWVPQVNNTPFTAGVDSFVLDSDGDAEEDITTKLRRDEFNNNIDNIFTQGSKFNDYLTALHWGLGGAPNKNDIHNGMFHASGDASGNQWVFIGGDRLDVAGTSYIDFEFLQGTIAQTANSFTGTGLAGGRTIGDINISMEYNNGGSAPKVVIYRWAPTNEAGTAWAWDSTGSHLITQAYAKTNLVTVDVPFGAFNNLTYQPYAFVESAINVTQLVSAAGGNCSGLTIKTLWIKTKASSSSTAALKDFMDPISLDLTIGDVTITPIGPFCAGAASVPLVGVPTGGTFSGNGVVSGTTFSPTDAGVGTHTITYVASAGVNCTKTATMQVVVNPNPTTTDPTDQVVCNNTSTTAVTFVSSPTGATFAWTNNTTSIGLAAGGSGNISAFTATNSGTENVVATIQVAATADGCTGASQSFTITVKPTPTVADPTDQVLCNGVSTNAVNFSGTVAGTTFAWTNNTASIGLAASGSGNIASFPAVNLGTSNVVATIEVTPTAATCTGSPQSFTITVKPTPTVNDPTDQTICAGASTTLVTFSSAVTGTTFAWTNNTTSIGLAASGSGNIASFVGVNAGPGNVTATITVTPTAAACSGTPQNFTITVNANPSDLTADVIQPTCSTPTGTITVTSGTTGLTFSINSTTPADFTNNTGVFSGLSAGSYTIRSKNAAGCISNGLEKTIDPAAAAPPAGEVDIITNPSCSSSTGTLNVVVASTGLLYSSDFEISETGSGDWYPTDHVFTFTAGAGYNFTVRRKSDHTCTTTVVCLGEEEEGGANLSNNTIGSTGRIANAAMEAGTQTTVKAFPNPFSDRVKFAVTSPEAGYGSLDVMNMLGQKVKTVFQGQLNAGSQNFEMVLPQARYSTLFYILRVNGKQVTGKLVQRN